MSATHDSGHHPHITPLWVYMAVGGALLFFTIVTVASAQIDLGVAGNLVLAMVIATFKASLVAMIFMHLLWDNKLYLVLFISSLLFLTIFIVFTLFDTTQRGRLDLIKASPINPVGKIYADTSKWNDGHGHGHDDGHDHPPAVKPWTGAHDEAGTVKAPAHGEAGHDHATDHGAAPAVVEPPVIAGDAAAGKAKFMICTTCHGPNGQGMQPLKAPAIAGASDWYVKASLQKFLNGGRGSDAAADPMAAQMKMMAATVLQSEEDVNNMVAHLATLAETEQPATIKGDVEAGKAKFALCATCHGANGEGNYAQKGPRLTHLADWYVLESLQKFKAGKRGAHANDPEGMMMAPMAATLTDDDMKNVAAYIRSLADKKAE